MRLVKAMQRPISVHGRTIWILVQLISGLLGGVTQDLELWRTIHGQGALQINLQFT